MIASEELITRSTAAGPPETLWSVLEELHLVTSELHLGSTLISQDSGCRNFCSPGRRHQINLELLLQITSFLSKQSPPSEILAVVFIWICRRIPSYELQLPLMQCSILACPDIVIFVPGSAILCEIQSCFWQSAKQ